MSDMNELLNHCLYFTSNKFSRIIAKMADEEFRITGLSPTYAFLISIVYEHKGISQKQIGKILHMTPSTITRFIDKLQTKDLLLRKTDGKNTFIYLTEKGELLQVDINKAWNNLNQRYTSILNDKDKRDLIVILNKLTNKLENLY